MRKLGFLAGAAVGYVLGAKAGRERYEQIRSTAQKLANHPTVQQAKTGVQDQASRLYGSTKDKISHKVNETSWIPGGNHDAESPMNVSELTDDTWAASTRSG